MEVKNRRLLKILACLQSPPLAHQVSKVKAKNDRKPVLRHACRGYFLPVRR